jgi:hypothetical protein
VFFQYILKGIPGLTETEADEILLRSGIRCNLWHRHGELSSNQRADALSRESLFAHLHKYDQYDHETGRTFGQSTPYISTTAGTVEEEVSNERIIIRDAFFTAVQFGTANFLSTGYVYYGYVLTLGKPSFQLQEFAEEVRDLHLYLEYMRFRDEGEVVAKFEIPSIRLSRYERYNGPELLHSLRRGERPRPIIRENPLYCRPESYANIRGTIG